ncbi:MAG: hypothetical protein ACK41T_01085 [Pseudobdellovibrio sp.]
MIGKKFKQKDKMIITNPLSSGTAVAYTIPFTVPKNKKWKILALNCVATTGSTWGNGYLRFLKSTDLIESVQWTSATNNVTMNLKTIYPDLELPEGDYKFEFLPNVAVLSNINVKLRAIEVDI